MDKKLLSRFFIFFTFGYLLLLLGGVYLYNTGQATYKTHSAKHFEDPTYLSQTFGDKNNQLASKNGEVQAFFGPASKMVTNYAASKIYEGIETNAEGFVQTQITSLIGGTAMKATLGCTMTEFQEAMETSNSEAEFLATDKCPGVVNSPINKFNPDALRNEIAGSDRGQGIISIFSAGTRDLSYIETHGINDSLYAQSIINQIPIVGEGINNKVFAANDDPLVTKYALGKGFFSIWQTTLRFTYFLIIIPTVAFGFAIMFRMQINPQTQITLMRAIPRLLLAILLITFSYPIASLMLRVGKVISDVAIALVWTMVDTVPDVSYPFGLISGALGLLGNAIETIGLVIMFFIIVLIILINLFRWIIAVISSLIKIGFLIALAPLIILVGAFPGKETVIVNYFKNLGGEILGYFGMYILLQIAFALYAAGWNTLLGSDFLVPLIFGAVSLSVLWKSPSAPKLIKQAIGVEPLLGGGDPKKR